MTPSLKTKKDKAVIGLEIEKMVRDQHLTYLEATTAYMEENNIEISQLNSYISTAIIDKIGLECIDTNVFRPSFSKVLKKPSLDHLF